MNSWEKDELLRATRSLCWGGGAAAGLLTATGDIVTAAKVPPLCAELLALSQAPYAQVSLLVSLVDGLIVAPCGSCRQALVDRDPSMRVLVPGEQIVQARDLLPFADANPSNPRVARPSRHALRSHDEEEESYFVTWQV
ncbi:cytidine deaminase [Corynebacterium glucuronolyticum]